jgi:hypothetical protein
VPPTLDGGFQLRRETVAIAMVARAQLGRETVVIPRFFFSPRSACLTAVWPEPSCPLRLERVEVSSPHGLARKAEKVVVVPVIITGNSVCSERQPSSAAHSCVVCCQGKHLHQSLLERRLRLVLTVGCAIYR